MLRKVTEKKANTSRQQHSLRTTWWKIGYGIWLFFNIVVVTGLICSSYAGMLNPVEVAGAGIVGMTLPGWFAAAILLVILDLIWWRRTAILPVLGLLSCAQPLWNFCPLNLPAGKLDINEEERAFTLLTYNTLAFADREMNDSTANHTVEYIINQDADVVCLQEVYIINQSDVLHITSEQIDALHRRYPYIVLSGASQAILSKYPVKPLHIDYYRPDSNGGDFAAYQLEIMDHKVTIFNCHFQSIGLTAEDKQLYTELTDGKAHRNSVGEVSNHLLAKLMHANQRRARQAEMIGRYIKHYGGENVIVCGDFNDVPGCYTLRRLADFDLKEVYPQVGFGPVITYNANRFYFRIDHVLYRGDFKPHSMVRGSLMSSDHYPLTTTFLFNE